MILRKTKIVALVLATAIVLSGCSDILQGVQDRMEAVSAKIAVSDVVAFRDMEYTRPELQKLEEALQKCCDDAQNGKNVRQVMDSVYGFYDVYDRIYTDYAIAQIRYYCDTSDIYWSEEYNYCTANISAAEAAYEELQYALAASPYREALEEQSFFGDGYFDAYDGESIWDETFLALMEEESRLQNRYYEITAQAADEGFYSEEYFSVYGSQLAQLFLELIALRQQQAAYAGYDSYPEFAYELYHYRDYTPAQAEEYLQSVGAAMVPLYRQLTDRAWEIGYAYCDEQDTFSYVKRAAKNMGGPAQKAFACLERGKLYHIAPGENKISGAFETYLWSYYEPFIYMCPVLGQSDKLTFAHEFGHFVNDYVCYGSVVGTDVAEVQSQAMEYLSLLYNEETEGLEAYKLADCLCTFVEQSAYALFEQQVYQLEGEELTVQNIQELYTRIGTEFGFDSWDWDNRDYVSVEHYFTSPMYIVGYVVSNDVAFQIYQLEKEEQGAGLAIYNECVGSMDSYLVTFAENYGLVSPFDPGRPETVAQTLQAGLAEYL